MTQGFRPRKQRDELLEIHSQMFTTSTPHVVADVDDDEFDWEAAVREIDVACEGAAKASTSTSTYLPDPPKKSTGVTRQSTLDSFIGRKPTVENRPSSPHRLDNNFIAQKSTVEDQPSTSHRVNNSNHVGGGGDFIEDDKVSYVHVDLEAAKTWIYPVNIPVRNYQLSITETALFANTLVSLPTGLGKTLIAAVVMYNYFRWFPEGKIVFTAPSRPLVMQQIEACHNIVGIPQEWAIDMTGQMSPSKRACFWKAKRVFFVTPQVFEKDIQSGICLVKHLVCLVIDEAHRATGNYSYCVAVRELMSVPVQLRILALTATPGSKQQTIQSVINNLYISKLEYRTESDNDVSPYMHNRKLDLVKVEMGKDATDIDRRLREAMQPFATKLSGLGLLHIKDCQMLSPHHLLTCRDKYRQAPPKDLLQMKDIEGYFGVVITFSHIRKLLSSHGIKSAYELLEEKLKQGCFARFMNRNEGIWEAKRLMEQTFSHGAPYPKLLKMREILIDHFKKNNPQSSRVIIFSNFRGSVRDIMDSLSSIGELVKAAEFIGQSSGKTSKGQTQKVQQAVLQKFRAGGYNVIIATSIGEEGLDIMEVDLVICFDANISPLRMIQRMGRTGRKHDGRVVVLACEGTELKGYYRKQATSKSIMKHMHNGGMNSFDFHSSPRMIPHICKPEVQFVKFSIEQFLPRGRKWKVDSLARPTFENKLSDPETELIAKYFHSSKDSSWKPSLIAFPLFQAYPSRVHKVMHSFRTQMLIDTMQHLQGLSFFNDYNALPVEVQTEPSSCQCLEAVAVVQDGITEEEQAGCHGSQEARHSKRVPDYEPLPMVFSSCKEKQHVPNLPNTIPSHCFLFGTNFVSLDAFGMVSIKSVPSFPFLREVTFCKSSMANRMEVVNGAKENTFPSKMSSGDKGKLTVQIKSGSTDPDELRDADYNFLLNSRLCNSDIHAEKMQHEVEGVILLTPSPKGHVVKSDESVVETPPSTRKGIPLIFGNVSTSDCNDTDLSPRLTNMLENGLIPESPLDEAGNHFVTKNIVCMPASSEHVNSGLLLSSLTGAQANKVPKNIPEPSEQPYCKVGSEGSYPVPVSPVLPADTWSKAFSAENTCNVKICTSLRARECLSTSVNGVLRTPSVEINNFVDTNGHISDSPINEELHTPIINLTNNCSEDWRLSSGEASKSTMTTPKFKRLRKHREFSRRMSAKRLKESSNGPISDINRNFTAIARDGMKHRKVKDMTGVNLFIEVEAEVSSDAEVSDDEEEDKDTNSYDDSFIDDRVNLTGAGTQADANGIDMMAIYRRSLLTQSPREVQPNCSIDFNPDSMPTKTDETGSCSSEKTSHSLQTPQTGLHSQSAQITSTSCQRDRDQISLVTLPDETSVTKIENRKRKLDFHQARHGPESPLQPQRLFQSDAAGGTSLQGEYETNIGPNVDMFSDDLFYEGLDLDELEAQATKLLKNKSGLPIQTKQADITNDLLSSPSFDLGI